MAAAAIGNVIMSHSVERPAPAADKSAVALSWGGEFAALIKLGWPLILAQLAQNALLTTDVIMLGWLGSKYLAAATLANALFFAVQIFGVGVTSAVAPMVAQALGARDVKSVRRIVRQGLWVSLGLVVLLLPIVWNIRAIYVSIGQDPELATMAETFVHAAVWLFAPAFMTVVMRSFLSAHGATRIILLVTVLSVPLNALLNYLLIFGNWGFPRLELTGSGIATTLVNLAMLLMFSAYVVTHRKYRRYHIFARFFEADWARLRELLRVGVPIGFMLLAEAGLFTFSSLLQGWLGTDEVAAHAVALQLSSMAFMVPLGLSQATTVRVGHAVGAGNSTAVGRAGWVALIATLGFMSTTALAFWLAPHPLVALFLNPDQVENTRALMLAASFMSVAALFQLADGTQVAMAAALRGLSDTRMPLIIALIGYWGLGFPIAYLMGFNAGLGGLGIWFGLAAGLGFVAIALTARFALRDRLHLVRRAMA